MPMSFKSLMAIAALAAVPATAAERVGAFSDGSLAGWEEKSFEGSTDYTLVRRDDRSVLHARCDGTASVLYREQEVDLRETPILQWSWRVDAVFSGIEERSKRGDDYPARVYVVVGGGLLPWRSIALNYVWASELPQGADWPNAFTDNAHMIALRSGTTGAGQWQTESRNVREDFRRAFGREIDSIDGVAVMTDCDNTGGQAEAWYGDLRFVSEAAAQ
jgi:hypothetical protein